MINQSQVGWGQQNIHERLESISCLMVIILRYLNSMEREIVCGVQMINPQIGIKIGQESQQKNSEFCRIHTCSHAQLE